MEVTVTHEEHVTASDAFKTPTTITVNEHEYTLAPLQMDDFAACETYMRSVRLNAYLEATRNVPLPPEERAKATAEIVSKPVPLGEQLASPDGQLYLLWRSISRTNGAMPFKDLRKQTTADVTLLGKLMLVITGLERPKEKSAADPTTIGLIDSDASPNGAT
jgi:hypothetical protein